MKEVIVDRFIESDNCVVGSMQLKVLPISPPPDLELCVELDRYNHKIIYFSVHSRAIGYSFANFGQVTLQASPLEKIQAVYEQLNVKTACTPPTDLTQKTFAEKRLAVLGNELWKELIPEQLKQEYWKFKDRVKTLLITSDEPWIPWELIKPYRYKDNGNREESLFWCQQFDMSRWLAGPSACDELYVGPSRAVAPHNTSLADVKEELNFVNILHSLYSGIDSLQPLHNRTDVIDWLREENFSILHFACHGAFDNTLPNESTIKLSDGVLCPSDIGIRFAGQRLRPLIFINACHGGRNDFNFTKLGGWAAQLLEARVGVFIGALWEISDELALHFTREFYREFLEKGRIVSHAFRKARETIRNLAPYDPTWLSYVLYADPNCRIQDLDDQEKASIYDLLLQLKAIVETEPGLDIDDREEAIEQLQILATIRQKIDDVPTKKIAKKAIKILKGTPVSNYSPLAEACSAILPEIAKYLGI